MSISLFSHNSNPATDRRLCRKSNSYVADLVVRGEAFMIDAHRAQLFAPRPDLRDWRYTMNQPALVPGRNACRKIGKVAGHIFYKVKAFSYPIPAVGARSRAMNVSVINNRTPVSMISAEVTA